MVEKNDRSALKALSERHQQKQRYLAQQHVSFRFNNEVWATLEQCRSVAKQVLGREASTGETVRMLIELYEEIGSVTLWEQKRLPLTKDVKAWLGKEITQKFSLAISEEHRVALRKLEFYIQKTNWSLPVDRNDTVQLLIISYGQLLLSEA